MLLFQPEAEGRLAWVEPDPVAQGADRHGTAMLARKVSPRLRTLAAGFANWTALIVADGATESQVRAEREGIVAAQALVASLRGWRLRPAQIVVMLLGEDRTHGGSRVHDGAVHAALEEFRRGDHATNMAPSVRVVWVPSLEGAESARLRARVAYALLALASPDRTGLRSLGAIDAEATGHGHYRLGRSGTTGWAAAIALDGGAFDDGIQRQCAVADAVRERIEDERAQLKEGVALVDVVAACDAENVPKPVAQTLDGAIARAWYARLNEVEVVSNWARAGFASVTRSRQRMEHEAGLAWDRCRRGVLASGERTGASSTLTRSAIRERLAKLDQTRHRQPVDPGSVREPALADADTWEQHAAEVAFTVESRPRFLMVGAVTTLSTAAVVTMAVVSQTALSSLVAAAIGAAATLGTAFTALHAIRRRVVNRVSTANSFAQGQNARLLRFREDLRAVVRARGARRIDEWNRGQLDAALENLGLRESELEHHGRVLEAISKDLTTLAPKEGTPSERTKMTAANTEEYDVEKPPFMNGVCHSQRFIRPAEGPRFFVDGAGRQEAEEEARDLRGVETVHFESLASVKRDHR